MDEKELGELSRLLAKRLIAGRWQGTSREAAELLAKSLELSENQSLEQAFIRALMLELLLQANNVYTFPYSERQIMEALLPIWCENFRGLAEPFALRQAFMRYYREYEEFPVPSIILDLLPQNAFAKPGRTSQDDAGADPELRRKICREIKEKCRVLKFMPRIKNNG